MVEAAHHHSERAFAQLFDDLVSVAEMLVQPDYVFVVHIVISVVGRLVKNTIVTL